MACGTDKVETCMDSKIDFVLTFWLLFLTHVRFVLYIRKPFFFEGKRGVT